MSICSRQEKVFRTYVRSVAWIVALKCTRDHGSRVRVGATTAGDIDLCAANIELDSYVSIQPKYVRLVIVRAYLWRRSGIVDAQLLDSEEIFAVGDAPRDIARIGDYSK